MNSNLQIFKNEQFGQVRTLAIENRPYFVGRDVAEILGYNEPHKAIARHCNNYIKKKVKTNGGEQLMQIIPKEDIYVLISKCKTLSHDEKLKLIKEWNLEEKVLVVKTRDEIEFLDKLEEALKSFNIKGIRQYNILTYRIDYYIPKLNIAIEYDENDHKQYTYKQHELRQKLIEKELGCRFIRVSDSKSDAYNIGLVIKRIFEKGMVA